MLGAVPLSDFVPSSCALCSFALLSKPGYGRVFLAVWGAASGTLLKRSRALSRRAVISSSGCSWDAAVPRVSQQSGRPSCLVISPSLLVLSLLNRISPQLTKCHASEGSPISLALQTFYLSISLSSNGHTFTFYQLHKVQVGLHNFSAIINLSIFSVSESEKVRKEVHRHTI